MTFKPYFRYSMSMATSTSKTSTKGENSGGPVHITATRVRKNSRNDSGQISNSVRRFYDSRCTASRGRLSENPIRDHRLHLNLSIKQFADMMRITEHAVIRVEQGFYPNVPQSIVSNLGGRIEEEYDEWKVKVRRHHFRVFGNLREMAIPSDTHPLDFLYENWSYTEGDGTQETFSSPVGVKLNDTEVSKLLCLNQSVIHYWHNRPNSQHTIPSQFIEALLDNGYSKDEVQMLAAAYNQFRLYRKDDKVTYTSLYSHKLNEIREELRNE